jgi:hypothetical protein
MSMELSNSVPVVEIKTFGLAQLPNVCMSFRERQRDFEISPLDFNKLVSCYLYGGTVDFTDAVNDSCSRKSKFIASFDKGEQQFFALPDSERSTADGKHYVRLIYGEKWRQVVLNGMSFKRKFSTSTLPTVKIEEEDWIVMVQYVMMNTDLILSDPRLYLRKLSDPSLPGEKRQKLLTWLQSLREEEGFNALIGNNHNARRLVPT